MCCQSIENLEPRGPTPPIALALCEVIPVPSALELTRDLKSFTLEGTTTPLAPWENYYSGESSVTLWLKLGVLFVLIIVSKYCVTSGLSTFFSRIMLPACSPNVKPAILNKGMA